MSGSLSQGKGRFPSTSWSLLALAQKDRREQREALGEFLRRYLPALRVHLVRRRGFDADRAEDLAQGFAADKVLEQGLLQFVVRGRGRFRSFLLAALDNYVANVIRREKAAKRSPAALYSLESKAAVAEGLPNHEPGDPVVEAWARQVIAEALRRMKQDCEQSGRTDVWGVFEGRVLGPTLDGQDPLPYGQLVEKYGFRDPAQASNAVITGKRQFSRTLRAVVGEYALNPEDIEAEIAELRRILSR